MPLRWERVDLGAGLFRLEETKTEVPLELPVMCQLRGDSGAAAGRRRGHADGVGVSVAVERVGAYGGASGALREDRPGGGLRNAFITLAERELILLRSLTKRLVNHARRQDVTEGYAADWTVEQLREPAQRIADRIDELMGPDGPAAETRPPAT